MAVMSAVEAAAGCSVWVLLITTDAIVAASAPQTQRWASFAGLSMKSLVRPTPITDEIIVPKKTAKGWPNGDSR